MTIKELYEWSIENGVENAPIHEQVGSYNPYEMDFTIEDLFIDIDCDGNKAVFIPAFE